MHALGLRLRRIFDGVEERILRRNLRAQFLRLDTQPVQVIFPPAEQEALHRAIRLIETAIGTVVEQPVVFLFELVAVEIVEEEIAPQIERLGLERDRFEDRLRPLALGLRAPKRVLFVHRLALFPHREHVGLKAPGIELRARPVFEEWMFPSAARQVFRPTLERFEIQFFPVGGGVQIGALARANRRHITRRLRRQHLRQLLRLRIEEIPNLRLLGGCRLLSRLILFHDGFRRQRNLGVLGALENALERVIVGRRNRIEFVVVALRAAGGQTEEHASGGVHTIVLRIWTEAKESQPGREVLVRPGFAQQIAGKLRFHKSIEGQVPVEGVNHPIAIAESVGVRGVDFGLKPIVGIPGQIQPIAAPAFAVARGIEQAVHEFRPGSGRGIIDEIGDLPAGGRQSGQVIVNAADQCARVGEGGRARAFGFHLRQQEAIDIRFRPGAVFHRRRQGFANRLQRPE